MNPMHLRTKFIAAIVLSLSTLSFAQTPKPNSITELCTQPLVLNIDFVKSKVRYELKGKVLGGYPLDDIANETMNCEHRPLFVVVSWDVPLYALNTPGKLQLDKVRYFIKGRDEHTYVEIAYGRMYPSLPLTSDIAPILEDDGTLHPPTKIPHTKGNK